MLGAWSAVNWFATTRNPDPYVLYHGTHAQRRQCAGLSLRRSLQYNQGLMLGSCLVTLSVGIKYVGPPVRLLSQQQQGSRTLEKVQAVAVAVAADEG